MQQSGHFDMDKLSYEIFSILESNFLFGYGGSSAGGSPAMSSPFGTPVNPLNLAAGKVRILSIDGGAYATDALLAALALANLESSLRRRTGDPAASIADFFDVAAGSGVGGLLAAMLFTRGADGQMLFTAEGALRFLVKNCRKLDPKRGRGFLPRIFHGRGSGGIFRKIFCGSTLRDTVKPLLVPCYDLLSAAPFLFSRADAVETDGYDFRMWEVCASTCSASPSAAFDLRSVDGRTRIAAVGGGAAMGNPAAAAITHVLNNKHEFPLAAGVDDLLVLSLGGCDAQPPSAADLARIIHENASDVVDQAVAMAFGEKRENNYLRIQAHRLETPRVTTASGKEGAVLRSVEATLGERNVHSVLFRGKKISERTNAERLEWFSSELIKEQARRKTAPLSPVALKQVMTPRTSSATTATTITVGSSAMSTSSSTSP